MLRRCYTNGQEDTTEKHEVEPEVHYIRMSMKCSTIIGVPGQSAVEVSLAPGWVEVEHVRLQSACSEGVAEPSSTVEHVGRAVNLTGGKGAEEGQDFIRGPHTHSGIPFLERQQ